MPDPTLKALEELDKPGKFIVKRDVPIFCEHVDPKTGKKIGRAELERMAEVNNRRILEEGTPGSIVIGHTPGRKEEDILHVGYRKNHRVKRFGPKQKLGLVCDFYYKPDLYHKAKQYPHRSVELWTKDLYIDPVSILARAPRLDLGLLLPDEGPMEQMLVASDGCQMTMYSRGGERRIYQLEEENMGINEILDGFQAVIDKARASTPADDDTPKLYSKAQLEAVQVERDEALRQAREAKQLYQKETRLGKFKALKDEGVILDVDAEYKDTEDFDDAKFDAYLSKVKKCYARGATGGGFIGTDSGPGDDETEYQKRRQEIMDYAEKNKVTVFQARKAVMGR